MLRHFSTLFSLLVLSLHFAACGGEEEPERPFVLADAEVSSLVKQGMEKEIIGDTVIAGPIVIDHDTAVSRDGSKRAWCEGRKLHVADLQNPEGIVLHEETDQGSVLACVRPAWSDDGSEISFIELLPSEGGSDSVYQVTRVIIALAEGEGE